MNKIFSISACVVTVLVTSYNISFAQNVFPTASGTNVGVGTSAPAYRLQVHRTTNANGTAAFFGSTSTASVFNYSTTENTYIRGGKAGSVVYVNDFTGAGGIVLGNAANAVNVPGSVNVTGDINMGAISTIQSPTQLVLRSSNSYFNVTPTGLSAKAGTGTGTFSLAGSQSISGSLSVTGDITMAASSTIYSPTNLYLAGGNMRLNLANSGTYGVQTFSYSSTSPATGIVGGIYQFITGNGYVKIGNVTTPNPAGYKLYVDQGILTEKVKVAVAGTAQWADYVFAEEYELMPLSYVEQYIKQHKHLPNVPSAEEMVEEGNDLGKTSVKLLEKIEELTLYIIDQQKRIQHLEKRLDLHTR